MIVSCVICNSPYKRIPYHEGKIFTCGKKECTSKYLKSVPNKGRFKPQNNRIAKKCLFCSEDFTPYNTLTRRGYGKFCSHACYSKSMKKYTDQERIIRKRIEFRIRWALHRGRTKKLHTLVDLIGCDIKTFKNHLESKFTSGMTWDNYGANGWQIDHIIPVSSFNLSDPEQQLKAFHYTNTQPLWWIDNVRKGAKTPAMMKEHQQTL